MLAAALIRRVTTPDLHKPNDSASTNSLQGEITPMATGTTSAELPRLRIAVDIGGTFTDLAAFDEAAGELRFGKALSTHDKLVDGIQNTPGRCPCRLSRCAPVPPRFHHRHQHAARAHGRRTALLTTEGFRDIYEIGRVNRPDAYNLFFRKHVPLVDRSSRA